MKKVLYFLSFGLFIVSQNLAPNSMRDQLGEISRDYQTCSADHRLFLNSPFICFRIQVFEPHLADLIESAFHI